MATEDERNGAGIGASHQTGWTGDIAYLIWSQGTSDAESFLQGGTRGRFSGAPKP